MQNRLAELEELQVGVHLMLLWRVSFHFFFFLSFRYCRFQKCVEAGMNPKWVLNDAEKRRRAERLDAIKRERVR